MLELAVTTRAETFERIREPLADRGIRARYVRSKERTFAVTDGSSDAGVGGRGDEGSREFDGFDVGYVYPSRLMEGGVVDALLGVPWVNGPEAVLTSRNKGGVLARLAAADVPVPETVMVSNPVDREALVGAFEAFEPPVVVKPNSATRGVGVAKAHDLDSFLGVVDYLGLLHDFPATGDRSFLVQEYLPEVRDYRAMVVDGEYAGAVERRLPDADVAAGRWKHNVHRDAEVERVELSDDRRRLVERVSEVLDVDLLGVDLLVSGDRVVVGETNARPTIDDEALYEPDFYDRLAALIDRTAEG